MNKKITLLALLLTATITTHLFAQAERQVPKTWTNGGYLEYLPEGYNPSASKLYPTIIFLHGSGEIGSGSATDLKKVLKNGPPLQINKGNKMCFTVNGKTECFIVLSPQSSKSNWVGVATPFTRWAMTKYKIDPNRLFITGLSMGGRGCWEAINDMLANEKLYSAAVPVAASGTTTFGTAAANHNLPIWAIHGDADRTIKLKDGKLPVDAMVRLKASPGPIFTVDPGADHGRTFEHAYRVDHSIYNPNIYEWLLSLNGFVDNTMPTITATDKVISWPTNSATLTASAKDANGDAIVSYYWAQTSGNTLAVEDLNGFSTSTLNVTNLTPGTYTFTVVAVNDNGQQAYDDVTLTVNNTVALPPLVSVGADKIITLPTNAINITATATDPNPGGSITSYRWSKVGGPSLSLTQSASATVSISQMVEGIYTFNVVVTNNKGATAADQVVVTVKPATTNVAPTVTIGGDVTLTLPKNSETLTGTATDKNGTITGYTWTKQSGPTATLAGTTSPSLRVSNLTDGTYVFRLTVKDNQNATAYDEVKVMVNQPPVANAGSDQTITLPTNSLKIKGSGTDPDGSIAGYLWSKQSGPSASLGSITAPSLSPSNMEEGVYVFRLTVRDSKGASDYDDVTVTVKASADQTPPPPPTSSASIIYRVDNGGLAITSADKNWDVDLEAWQSTQSPYLDVTTKTYTTGSTGWKGVNNTGAPDNIFGGNRYATESSRLLWHFPTGDGSFQVNLYFAEKYRAVSGKGQRVFDVNMENKTVLYNIDIYASGGWDALKKTATVSVTDGTLDIEFIRNINDPQVNGIEIIKLDNASARITSNSESVTDNVVAEVDPDNLISAFPNPIGAETTVHFNAPQSGMIKVKVLSSLGTPIKEIELTGNYTTDIALELPVENMASGVYLLDVQTQQSHKLIKLLRK